jgi:xanthine dehydrogenase accessory factor
VREIAAALLDVLNSGRRGALATVVRTSGSTPQQPGARLLLKPDGSTLGTVGGGAIEQAVLEALRETQSSGKAQVLVRDLGFDLGMCCGGRMEIFLEPVESAPRLVLFGAGHVARATAPLARSIGFEVCVVDEREEQLTSERFPECKLELCDPPALLKRQSLAEGDWLLVVTHDHALDEQTLELCLRQPVRYIGLVGSRRKVFRLLQRIAARAPELGFDRVYAPVGLDLGAVGPQEIAVSIAAELVALRRSKPSAHLSASGDARLRALLRDEET